MKYKINFWNKEPKPLTRFEMSIIKKPVLSAVLSGFLFILIFVIMGEFVLRRLSYHPFPGVMAAGEMVMQGICKFNGDPVDTGWGQFHTPALIAIIVSYLMFPAWLIHSIAKWKNTPAGDRANTRFRATYMACIFSGAIVFNLVFLNTTVFFGSKSVHNNVVSSQKVSSARDYLTIQLTDIDYSARTYFYLPAEAGGGGGSWKNYKLPAVQADERSFDRWRSFLTAEDVKNVFLLKPIENDTTIVITAIGNVRIKNNEEFLNADGRKNFVQVTATITPATHRYDIQN